MNSTKLITVVSIISLCLLATGQAETVRRGTRSPGINARQHIQRDRIGQGIRSGQLTRDEVKDLAEEQRDIRQEEQEYKSDGVLTKDERIDLHQDLNQASKNIYEQKHDDQKR